MKQSCYLALLLLLLFSVIVLTSCGLSNEDNLAEPGKENLEPESKIACEHIVVLDEAVEPTCAKNGLTEGSHCSKCGIIIQSQNIIPRKEHTPITDSAIEPTETKYGATEGSHCSVCKKILTPQYIVPATSYKGFSSYGGYFRLGQYQNGEKLQEIYELLEESATNYCFDQNQSKEKVFDYDYEGPEITVDDMLEVGGAFLEDFWLDGLLDFSVTSYINGNTGVAHSRIVCYSIDEYRDGEKRVLYISTICEAIKGFLSKCIYHDTKFNTALTIHDLIIESIDYVYDENGEPENAKWAHSKAGVFEKRGAVCEGYAKAFAFLLNCLGFENMYVEGMTPHAPHAWNLVKMDNGQWYGVDVTFDDDGVLDHTYFCATASTFNMDHFPWAAFRVPELAQERYSYAWFKYLVDGIYYEIGYETASVYSVADLLVDVTIPSSVSINNRTYSVTGIAPEAFYHHATVQSILIPDSVTFIGKLAFCDCPKLKMVTLPNQILTIEQSLFEGCDLLESISLPEGITKIGEKAFSLCHSLKTVAIPDSVTIIGDFAFSSCDSMESISLPSNLTTIGYGAFPSLARVKIPKSVTSIGDDAFSNNADITIEDGNDLFYVVDDCLMDINGRLIVGNINVSIPTTGIVKSIGSGAFQGCQCDCIVIPDGVQSIGRYAFASNYSLKSVIMPKSVTSFGYDVFCWCNSLASIIYEGTIEEWNSIKKGTEEDLDWIGGNSVVTIVCNDGIITLPST